MAPKAEIRPTRRNKRVLLVLLTGAGNLGESTICHAAGVSVTAHLILARLESAGWAEHWPEGVYPGGPYRRIYRLTCQGRAKAAGLLGLEMPDA